MRGWERSAPPAQRQAGAASARPPALQVLVADPLRSSRGSRFPRAGFRLHRLVEEPKDRREALPGGQLVPLRPCNTERAPRHYLLEIREIGVGVCGWVCWGGHPPPSAASWKGQTGKRELYAGAGSTTKPQRTPARVHTCRRHALFASQVSSSRRHSHSLPWASWVNCEQRGQ